MLPAKRVTAILLVLGTALTIYWQPLGRSFALKASDVAFVIAIGIWMLSFARERRPRGFVAAEVMFIPPLLASVLVATLFAYAHYHLGMSRNGTILLARLVTCIALFLTVRNLLLDDPSFRQKLGLAFLSPLALFPAMLIPKISVAMWDPIGRLQGLTVNANTAAVGYLIAFALAYTLTGYEVGGNRHRRALALFIVTIAMLALVLWTQSRAYFVAAFAAAVLGTVVVAQHHRLSTLKLAVAVSGGFALIVVGLFLLQPRALAIAQLIRISPAYRAFDVPVPEPKAPPPGWRWTVKNVQQVVEGSLQKVEGDSRMAGIRYYSTLLAANYWGLGLNYETKFAMENAPTKTREGTNTILDIPVYGGIGAVLSLAYLGVLIAKRTRRNLSQPVDENVPYTMGAVIALAGLWVAACLVGSPLFDYQFWILAAIALD